MDGLKCPKCQPFTIQNTSLYRWPEGLAITTLWACPNSNPKTLTVTIGLSVLELLLSFTPQLSAIFHASQRWSWVLCTASLHHNFLQSSMLPNADYGYWRCFPFLSFVFNTSASLLLFLYEGSWTLLCSAASFNAVGELSLLGLSGTVIFFDFSVFYIMVSSSDL